ncbi:hypothetical protein ID866_12864 [Astraeus odoratus]|nr:hypothetical protein ID866_12864 [Astraeus odoratus]
MMDQGQHPPDFSTPGFAGLVDLVMTDGGLSREQAIEALMQWWAETHVPPTDQAINRANAQANGTQQLLPQGAQAEDQEPPPQQPPPPHQPHPTLPKRPCLSPLLRGLSQGTNVSSPSTQQQRWCPLSKPDLLTTP